MVSTEGGADSALDVYIAVCVASAQGTAIDG